MKPDPSMWKFATTCVPNSSKGHVHMGGCAALRDGLLCSGGCNVALIRKRKGRAPFSGRKAFSALKELAAFSLFDRYRVVFSKE